MRSAAFALVVCFSLLLAPTVAAAAPSSELDVTVGTTAPCSVDATYRWFNYGAAAEAALSVTLTPGGTTGRADPNVGPSGSLSDSVSVPAGVEYVVVGHLFNNAGREIARSVQTYSGTCPA
jgi:hypothetical protein